MEQFQIQSNEKGLESLDQYIYAMCDEMHILNYFATLSVPVLQAAQNAIVHGNKNDETKRVTIECGDYCGGVYFEIQDEGNGFDFVRYGDLPEEGASGKGIFMMKQLSDRMVYTNGGSRVRLEFLIQGIESTWNIERQAALHRFFTHEEVTV